MTGIGFTAMPPNASVIDGPALGGPTFFFSGLSFGAAFCSALLLPRPMFNARRFSAMGTPACS
ncbi:MAG TPA: hypothetical protein VK877_07895 [Pseudolabrys sp.]|nr:hypothetical protein [Pseudolabrys sp.]